MKLLLDECLPVDFRHRFPNHEAHTAEWAGFKGKKNGELLAAAEGAGYQALITVDQGMLHTFTASPRRIAVIVISAPTNQIEDLVGYVDSIAEALKTIKPGATVSIR